VTTLAIFIKMQFFSIDRKNLPLTTDVTIEKSFQVQFLDVARDFSSGVLLLFVLFLNHFKKK
jgi:hypothetical protein